MNNNSDIWQYASPELSISKSEKFSSLEEAVEDVSFLLLENNKFDEQLTKFQLWKYIIFYYDDTKIGNLELSYKVY